MKKIYRNVEAKEYWDNRWEKAGVDKSKFENLNIYPVKYSNLVMKNVPNGKKVLEAGAGSGRLFFYYLNKKKWDIYGMDYSETAIQNIRKKIPNAQVVCASITDMPYKDEYFDVVMAFGLYHSIPSINDIDLAFKETNRVLQKGGKLIFSVRLDCFENYLLERIERKKKPNKPFVEFHKWQFDLEDIKHFIGNDFEIKDLRYVRNVSFLFKYDLFRHRSMKLKNFIESTARSEGFKLNCIGSVLDTFLHKYFPKMFSNLIVVTAEKKQE